jgi:hypothetical protein
MSEHLRIAIEEELSQLQERFGVESDIKEVVRKGFTGGEALLVVAGFVLSKVGGKLLESIGADLWSLIKNACRKLRSKAAEEGHPASVQLRIVVAPQQVTFTCQLDEESAAETLDIFIAGVAERLLALQQVPQASPVLREQHPAEFRYVGGRWTGSQG